MNKYKLCIIDSELMTLIKKSQENISKSDDIIRGINIDANSPEEARVRANEEYPINILSGYRPSMNAPEPPDINRFCYPWSNFELTSCELIE